MPTVVDRVDRRDVPGRYGAADRRAVLVVRGGADWRGVAGAGARWNAPRERPEGRGQGAASGAGGVGAAGSGLDAVHLLDAEAVLPRIRPGVALARDGSVAAAGAGFPHGGGQREPRERVLQGALGCAAGYPGRYDSSLLRAYVFTDVLQ
jgi:hypothetical protein